MVILKDIKSDRQFKEIFLIDCETILRDQAIPGLEKNYDKAIY